MHDPPDGTSFRIELTTTPSESEIARIRTGLSEFNRSRIPDRMYVPLVFTLFDAEGEFAGGLTGNIAYGWLFVDLLWVADRVRGQGQGSSLVLAAESEARGRGCRNSWLDTFSFQARDFYERLGYSIFGELEDFPPGHRRYFMRKALV
ncbi:MAG: family acetyltransferase [Bryobacterales bacterium]|nr:family acetyltransferase [Bryobacterales bacterium]